ncbi:MAG TPA: cupredoxin domain-containing protein, partial [Actinomycetota bacterium]|nr:cupredoxin domain-containing protein [Actinomycetota bacterium]
ENTQTYTVRDQELMEPRVDPVTGEVLTFTGWVDPNYEPEPDATPYPACWADEFAEGSPAPSGSGEPPASAAPGGSPGPSGSAAPSGAPSTEPVEIVASGIQFTTTDVLAPANVDFTINFDNQDANVPHDVDIRDANDAVLEDSQPFPGPEVREVQVGALPPGTYTFFCSVHPNMTGTLTAQ